MQGMPSVMTRRKISKKDTEKSSSSPEALMRLLAERMETCPDVESLNDQVITPFIEALEVVCKARGYVLNIFGETSNLIFTGDDVDSRAIYTLVENYLDEIAK